MSILIEPNRRRATWVRLGPFIRQLFESIANNFRGERASLSGEAVKAFFDRHRGGKPDPLIFDGSRSGYYEQLLVVMPRKPAVRFIDLGCGSAGLSEFLRARNISFEAYIGVDFSPAVSETAGRPNSTIHNVSIDDAELLKHLVPGTHIVMINSACYQESISQVPVLQAAARFQDAAFLVIEPYPGIFWDRQFDGICPRYRHPDQLVSEASALGWVPSQFAVFYLTKIGPLFLWPLAYSLSFRSAVN